MLVVGDMLILSVFSSLVVVVERLTETSSSRVAMWTRVISFLGIIARSSSSNSSSNVVDLA